MGVYIRRRYETLDEARKDYREDDIIFITPEGMELEDGYIVKKIGNSVIGTLDETIGEIVDPVPMYADPADIPEHEVVGKVPGDEERKIS